MKHTEGKLHGGNKSDFGTFNPSGIYDEQGNGIAQVYGIFDNVTLEDIMGDEGSRKYCEKGLANAAELVRRWNAHEELVTALKAVEYVHLGDDRPQCPLCLDILGHTDECRLGLALAHAKESQ